MLTSLTAAEKEIVYRDPARTSNVRVLSVTISNAKVYNALRRAIKGEDDASSLNAATVTFARKGKIAFRSLNVINEREYEVISKIALEAVLKEDFADRALIDSLVTSEAIN